MMVRSRYDRDMDTPKSPPGFMAGLRTPRTITIYAHHIQSLREGMSRCMANEEKPLVSKFKTGPLDGIRAHRGEPEQRLSICNNFDDTGAVAVIYAWNERGECWVFEEWSSPGTPWARFRVRGGDWPQMRMRLLRR